MKKQRKFLWTALLLFMVSIFAMGCVTICSDEDRIRHDRGQDLLHKRRWNQAERLAAAQWKEILFQQEYRRTSQRLGKGFLWENHPLFHKRHWLYGHRICLRQ